VHEISQICRLYVSNASSITGAFGNSDLGGKLASEFGQLSVLENLWLDSTAISGTIPTTYGRLSSLMSLYLSHCRLSSTIPSELGNLSFLREIELADNYFTGPFPSYPGLNRVNYLDVHGNKFASLVPSELGTFHDLKFLICSDCGLSGLLPSELGGKTAEAPSCLQCKMDATYFENRRLAQPRIVIPRVFRLEPEQPYWANASSDRGKGYVDITPSFPQ
jgi:Leucine-rich repeat (LRR) protein